jgi:hypothetical protein
LKTRPASNCYTLCLLRIRIAGNEYHRAAASPKFRPRRVQTVNLDSGAARFSTEKLASGWRVTRYIKRQFCTRSAALALFRVTVRCGTPRSSRGQINKRKELSGFCVHSELNLPSLVIRIQYSRLCFL